MCFNASLVSANVGDEYVEEAESAIVIETEGVGFDTVARLGPFSVHYSL